MPNSYELLDLHFLLQCSKELQPRRVMRATDARSILWPIKYI